MECDELEVAKREHKEETENGAVNFEAQNNDRICLEEFENVE